MPQMKAVQVSKPGGPLELVERPIPEPGRAQVRIKVEACGDLPQRCAGQGWALAGPAISAYSGPRDRRARRCGRAGRRQLEARPAGRGGLARRPLLYLRSLPSWGFHSLPVRESHRPQLRRGYAEYMIAPAEAVAAIPEDLPAAEAAPLLCAGITVYNALRNANARAGISWPSRASEDWAIWGFSTPARWASTPSPSGGAGTRILWRRSWALTSTSTPA